MTLFWWSKTANVNASIDPTINFAEGQPPSSLNDSNRAMMAATAKYRDDTSGSLLTTGNGVNYLLSTNQGFDSLAHLHQQELTFRPHVTNTGSQAFLNVDSLGTVTVRLAPNLDVPAGTLLQGVPYEVMYNNSDGIFYLKNFYNVPWMIPLGATLDYWGGIPPNSSFVFPYGQAISRATYATLYAVFGGEYGSGDGTTTFNLPDLRGRVIACPDNMGGGSDPNRLTSSPSMAAVRNSLGGTGGEAAHAQTTNEMPSHTHGNTLTDPGHAHTYTVVSGAEQKPASGGNPAYINTTTGATGGATTGITINNASQGSGTAFNVVQPTILGNRIMRII